MAREIVIDKGIQPFDDRTDLTRNNPDRKTFGRSGNDGLDLGNEYNTPAPPAQVPPPVTPPVVVPKFTHKLANGTVLEAATLEEMAALIEKEVSKPQAPPAPVDFEDKPKYTPLKLERKELTVQQKADILNLWKEDPQAAMRKLQEAEVGVTMEDLLRLLNDSQTVIRVHSEVEEGADFLGECETYQPTKENGKKLTDLIRSKGMPITKHNLMVAFNQLSVTDKTLLRKVDDAPPPPPDPNLHETPDPPTVVPSNQGLPTEEQQRDSQKVIREFASMSLGQQQAYFANLRLAR